MCMIGPSDGESQSWRGCQSIRALPLRLLSFGVSVSRIMPVSSLVKPRVLLNEQRFHTKSESTSRFALQSASRFTILIQIDRWITTRASSLLAPHALLPPPVSILVVLRKNGDIQTADTTLRPLLHAPLKSRGYGAFSPDVADERVGIALARLQARDRDTLSIAQHYRCAV